ncbi:MAG: rod shape-determining protein [Nitrosopumilus sp.]|nr:rod shape-determining protein [Nitrosopumilus sp.]MDA7958604.1 rod shape-determining protein [Nitrosopumilus sp.]MDA8030636.1 rod shape-determining protein [Alphaproteobacteria bacterium]
MLKVGLDIGTGFVKCASNYGTARFPSVCAKIIHGDWSDGATEVVGDDAAQMLQMPGAIAVRPVVRGRPDPRYTGHVEMLVQEALSRMRKMSGDKSDETTIVVGLPYEASNMRDMMSKSVSKATGTKSCAVVAQAVGTLVEMGVPTGLSVSIGQGTTEIVVMRDNKILDGESSRWASDFITRKISRIAHLDLELLKKRSVTCKKYAKHLAEGLAPDITDMARSYRCEKVVLSGGGILIPGVRDHLGPLLKEFDTVVPSDPVMSNARGLYKLVP